MAPPTLYRWESPRRARLIGALLLIACLPPGAPAVAQERVDPVPVAPEPIVEALSPFAGEPDSSRVASLLAEAAEHDFPDDETKAYSLPSVTNVFVAVRLGRVS